MLKMAIIGISGKMGKRLYEYFKDSFDIIGIDQINFSDVKTYKHLSEVEDKIDIVVDFSSIHAVDELKYAIDNKILTLSGTTGYDIKFINELVEKSNNLFYWSCNYANGIELFSNIAKSIKKHYPLFDFVEIHASTKKDSPSGTAKKLAYDLNIDENQIQSLRLMQAPPIHELIFCSKYERITIRHEVIDSTAFLDGFNAKLKELLGEWDNAKKIIWSRIFRL